MAVSKEDVKHIAELAKLKIKDSELDEYVNHLNKILEYVDKLNELDTDKVEPLAYPVEGNNVFREDIVKQSVSTEEALKNSPQRDDKFFKVPKVIE